MSDHPEIDPAEYRRVLGHFPTGVTVVTAHDGDGPVGMAIGSFASVSLDPPLVAFFAGKQSGTWARIDKADHFCVNVLGDDQLELCSTMASRAEDKFEGVSWMAAPSGSPVLPDVIATIDCKTDAIHDGGDHWIVVGRVLHLATHREAGPMVFFKGGYGSFAPND
ncbi:MAG: flavin reductase family protein [Actinomycetia bacterium]|nr:flavin reductase family protein [Actinomycetes bacterium]